jgi:hypothetical protein
VLLSRLATATRLLFALKATDAGAGPVENGEPGTGVSDPPETENTATLLLLVSAVATSDLPGLNAIDCGLLPVGNGDPDTGVKPGCAAAT